MPTLNPQDPLLIDNLLTAEERLVRDSARDFVQSVLEPTILTAHRQHQFPLNVVKHMGAMGLLGPTVSPEFGGAGLNSVCYGLIAREMEYCDSSFRSFASVQSSLVMHPIYYWGSEAQKKKYLPKLAKGELIGAFGLTEPDAGSNPNNMRTRAKKTTGGFILNGEKTWITNSPLADLFIIWGKDDEGEIRGFILERSMKGITTPSIEGKLSLQASSTGMIAMQDVFVPDDNMLPEAKGLKGPFACLNNARFGIAWGVTGAAQACFDAALHYTTDRHMFNKPLASHQLVQTKLANMATDIATSTLLALHIGRLKDGDALHPDMISMAKRHNTEKALNIARVARDMHGGNGIVDEYKVMRHMLNLESVYTYEGTHDIHGLIIGRALTDIAAFA